MPGSVAGSEHAESLRRRLLERLAPYGQEHLLAFWDELGAASQHALAREIEDIDFALLRRLFQTKSSEQNWSDLAGRAQSPPAFRLERGSSPHSLDEAERRGSEALARGEVGVILVAGGQGSRLGFDHPKGMFAIGPLSGAPLFQILIEKILARARRHGAKIPLYLMTSPATHEETNEYLERHHRFGLDKNLLRIFCQGTMPAIDASTGGVLLAAKDHVALSPDGHGGMLAALARSGSLDDVRRRGIKHLFYLQVDNPLTSMCDPAFIGYHLLDESELSSQVIAKGTLREKLGNVVVIDGKLQILEYSDLNPLSDEILNRKDVDGSPVFWAGSIAVHVFDVAFLERVADDAEALPFHIARKVVPQVDSSGKAVEPQKPNAIKFERFIFDLLPAARKGIAVEVDQATSFAPVKNAPGSETDSPEVVQRQMIDRDRRWLEQAGAKVHKGVAVEISPLYAQDPQELRDRIEPGLVVGEPRYFR